MTPCSPLLNIFVLNPYFSRHKNTNSWSEGVHSSSRVSFEVTREGSMVWVLVRERGSRCRFSTIRPFNGVLVEKRETNLMMDFLESPPLDTFRSIY